MSVTTEASTSTFNLRAVISERSTLYWISKRVPFTLRMVKTASSMNASVLHLSQHVCCTDEFQHVGRTSQAEAERMIQLHRQRLDAGNHKPLIHLRYNPDSYTKQDGSRNIVSAIDLVMSAIFLSASSTEQ